MSEMEWEDAPEVTVPRVRNWLNPALRSWARFMYGGYRRRFSLFEWFFFWPLIYFYLTVKLMVYAGVGLLMMLAYGVWALAECITYRRRFKRAALVDWNSYLRDQLEPPASAA